MDKKTLIRELFSICDKYIDVEDFVEFEIEFADIVKKDGLDLYKIYYNESFENIKNKYRRYDIKQKQTQIIEHQ